MSIRSKSLCCRQCTQAQQVSTLWEYPCRSASPTIHKSRRVPFAPPPLPPSPSLFFHLFPLPPLFPTGRMKVTIKHWHAVALWRWDTGNSEEDEEGDVCGICRVPFEGCCPGCKLPGDDCPLSEWPFPLHLFSCSSSPSLSISMPLPFALVSLD